MTKLPLNAALFSADGRPNSFDSGAFLPLRAEPRLDRLRMTVNPPPPRRRGRSPDLLCKRAAGMCNAEELIRIGICLGLFLSVNIYVLSCET